MNDFADRIHRLSPEKRELLLERLRSSAGGPPAEQHIPRRRDPSRAPLSFAQRRLWFLDQLKQERGGYQIVGAIRLEGELNQPALRQSLDAILQRHEVLRSVISVVGGEPVQIIGPPLPCPLPVIDLAELDRYQQDARVKQLLDEEQHRGFDLTRGPLLRATLLRLAASDHVLIVSMHHIVADGWSSGILRRELGEFYRAISTGTEPQLPTLPVQYADFSEWQRQRLQGQVLEEQLDYWRTRLAGLSMLQLPTDYPRANVAAGLGGLREHWLAPSLCDELYEFNRREGVTLYMTLLAAFQLLLARYSGQSDIAVGTPVASRNRSELEGLIGFFVNTLVMRTEFTGDPTFLQLLHEVRNSVIAAFAHQEVPFERLVEELQPQREAQRNPLFQVAFAVQNAPRERLEMRGLSLTPYVPEVSTTRFELELHVWEEDRAIRLMATFDRGLFHPQTVATMLVRLERLVQAAMMNSRLSVWELPLISEAERQQLLGFSRGDSQDQSSSVGLVEQFRRQVLRSPRAIAVSDGRESLSYSELDTRSAAIGLRLRTLGVQPETVVAIAVEPSAAAIVAMLGVVRAGGAYVPIDPDAPPARVASILAETNVRIVLTQQSLAERFIGLGRQLVYLSGDDRSDVAAIADDVMPTADNPLNPLAYVMYTSGSTGGPKGIAVGQQAIARLVLNSNYLQIGPGDVVAQLANQAFDAATFEIWGALLNGARLVVFPKETTLSTEEFGRRLREQRVSVAFLTTSLFQHHARHHPALFGNIRCLLFGGESADPAVVRAVVQSGKPERLIHVYGPTENTTFSTFFDVEEVPADAASVPIGRPLSGTEAYVLDNRMQLLPPGIPGELYLGGERLARGYVANAALTAEKFRPDPFSSQPGRRLYRTGDMVRQRADGHLEFLGRRDQQVKLRGFRIELSEIESVLRACPYVQEAVVMVRGEDASSRQLVAYVQSSSSADSAGEAVARFARDHLPTYMVPAKIEVVEAFPRSPHDKIDRAQLARLMPAKKMPSRSDGVSITALPRTPVEEAIAEIFAELLNLQLVSRDESFFDLGGHSLLATQLASRLREVFQVELPLGALFRAPSVAAAAVEIERLLRVDQPGSLPPLVRASPGERAVASFAQQRLWFLQRLQPNWGAWHVPWLVELRGTLDRNALQHALDAVVARHEALRTSFSECDGQPIPVAATSVKCPIRYVDLQSQAAEDQQEAVRRLAAAEQRDSFDLTRPPLMRSCLLQLEQERHVFAVTLHHIVCDGWSLGVLQRELAAGYSAFSAGRQLDLPDLPIQYADFAAWQRRRMDDQLLPRQLDYWRKQLADLPLLQLPTDRPRPLQPGEAGQTVVRKLSETTTRRLRELNAQQGTTLYMTILAAFKILLARYTGQEDIAVGTPIANRNYRETEELIGLFVNSIVLRTNLAENPTFQELLQQVRSTALAAYAHQDVPFERIVEELRPERHPHRHPLYQVVLAVQNAASIPGPWADIEVRPLEFDVATSRYDLQLDVWEHASTLQLNAFYDCDLFDRETIKRMLGHLANLLDEIVDDPARRVSEYRLISDEERDWLTSCHAVPAAGGTPECLHVRWERQAAMRPSATALVEGNCEWSYRELDLASNRVANCLRSDGISQETPVGLFVERSVSTVAGILGILKAGGAYVPLEPAWPDQRVAWILEETRAPVLLTQSSLLPRAAALAARVKRENGPPQLVVIDGDEVRHAADTKPLDTARPGNLAYIIYTSGTSGQPKGVLITHANVDRLVSSIDRLVAFDEHDCWTWFHSFAFDFSVWEMWGALLHGGRLVIVPYLISRSPREFRLLLQQQRVTVLNQTPTAFSQLLDISEAADFPRLRCIIFGGEALDVNQLDKWQSLASGTLQRINMYGITETTVHVTWEPLDRLGTAAAAEGSPGSPIGLPIPGWRIYLLDQWGNLAPRGCPGEICVGGAGLARGYLGDTALTAEKFVPDPYSGLPGRRLYRSGDLARHRPDGSLEYLGRRDHQVKVRGFRVELGEIESTLRALDVVRDAAVVYRKDEPGDERLVAYVVPESDHRVVRSQQSAEKTRLVDHWRQLYDDVYRGTNSQFPPELNLAGWNSSYTGKPIPVAEMREQIDQTVERILAWRPQRILEIGCGTGLLLYRLARHCEEYVGTDLSPVALEALRDRMPENVVLELRGADDFAGMAPHSVDAVVLNSVVQYFPDVDYLRQVLVGAAQLVRPGGVLFVGDVRSLPLCEAFHSSVELHRAEASTCLAELRERVRMEIGQERELLVDPHFFHVLAKSLARPCNVSVEPKRGKSHNELTRFRYDVTLHFPATPTNVEAPVWFDWQATKWSEADIRGRLRHGEQRPWGVLGVPNLRLREPVLAVQLLAELGEEVTAGEARRRLAEVAAAQPAIDPESLWELSREEGFRAVIRWSVGRPHGAFDVVFLPGDLDSIRVGPVDPELPAIDRPLANTPWRPEFATRLAQELRGELQQRLPDHMIPASLVVLDQFPLTSQGKLDRRALPAPDSSRRLDQQFAAPRNPLESLLVQVWSEVLRVRQVGIHDNFFDLGGHSLLATQVVARIRDACRKELPLRAIFESPTVAELAAALTLLPPAEPPSERRGQTPIA